MNYIIDNREQLLAEAREMYKSGVLWYPTKEEANLAIEEQSIRYQEDPIEPEIKKYFEHVEYGADRVKQGATASDIAKHVFSMTRVGRREVNPVVSALGRLSCGFRWLKGYKLYSPSFPQRG